MFSLDVLQNIIEIYTYKNQPKSKLFKQGMETCLASIFLSLLKTFNSQVEPRYFTLVVLFFKSFHSVLIQHVPSNQIQIFIQNLTKSIIGELQNIRKSSLQNFTLLNLKLEIFTNITNIKGIFAAIGGSIEVCLEQITHKFLVEPLKDQEVIDYLIVLLSDHFRHTKKFSSCHAIFIDQYFMKLSEHGKAGLIFEELFCLLSFYCLNAAEILN